jgi:hypothetical protein
MKIAKKTGRTGYIIIREKNGAYAVQATPRSAVPLTISGFETEDDARAWIEAERGKDSD